MRSRIANEVFDVIFISLFVVLALALGCLGSYLGGGANEPQKVQNDADALLPIMAGSGGF